MANEIIVLERGNGRYSFDLLYAIPVNDRIEIGGSGTTGQLVVMTPSSDLAAETALVLTQAEKDALDAGEQVCISKYIAIPEGSTDAEVLALAQGVYAANAAAALDDYRRRYKYIGRRFDKP